MSIAGKPRSKLRDDAGYGNSKTREYLFNVLDVFVLSRDTLLTTRIQMNPKKLELWM